MSELPPPPAYPPPPLLPPPPAPSKPGPSKVYVLVLAALGVLIIAGIVTAATMFATDEPVSTDLSQVQEYDGLSNAHTQGDVDYPQTPPVGGPHADEWLECGVYTDPVRDENVVHDLEHGTVWITYLPELGDDEVEELADLLPQNGILSPYAGQTAPVVVTVWGRQLELTGSDDPRLPLFIEEFGNWETAPEKFDVSCAGGVTSPDGDDGTSV